MRSLLCLNIKSHKKMNYLSKDESNQMAGESLSLEDMLLAIAKHGKPFLHNHDDGTWSCKTSMHVSSVGVSFEVRSDFTHKSPYSAVKQTLDRMIETLSKYGVRV